MRKRKLKVTKVYLDHCLHLTRHGSKHASLHSTIMQASLSTVRSAAHTAPA